MQTPDDPTPEEFAAIIGNQEVQLHRYRKRIEELISINNALRISVQELTDSTKVIYYQKRNAVLQEKINVLENLYLSAEADCANRTRKIQ